MAISKKNSAKLLRKSYAQIKSVLEIPDLLEHQRQSYRQFLQQLDVEPEHRAKVGIEGAFDAIFPLEDFSGEASLEYLRYELYPPKHDEEECRERGLTYAYTMKVIFRLVLNEIDPETRARSIRDMREQDTYFGEIPAMTERGTFIVDGVERVVVNQLHRSPGVFFEVEKQAGSTTAKPVFAARVIPYRGSWLDLEFASNENLQLKIDKRKKLPIGVFLRALGFSEEYLLNFFYEGKKETVAIRNGQAILPLDNHVHAGIKAYADFLHPSEDGILVEKDKKITRMLLAKLREEKIETFRLPLEQLEGRVLARTLIDPASGKVIAKCNEELTRAKIEAIGGSGLESFEILFIDEVKSDSVIRKALLQDQDKCKTAFEAQKEIVRRLRPGSGLTSITEELAGQFLNDLLFNPERYDLTRVGRHKLNLKLRDVFKAKGFEPGHPEERILRKEDILCVIDYLLRLKAGLPWVTPDDIDHLGNRRVRTVGELVENHFRLGLLRMTRAIKERFSSASSIADLMPHDLVNPKPVMAVLKEFFGSSQLSQFMDQTNPLAETTHKRRLSALGPGGLTRERAGFEVRDVHPSHYGRICPIETPEGQNIGLISSLTTYARINEFGFIETPYRRVIDGKVVDEIVYLAAYEEEDHAIAQANEPVDEDGRFKSSLLLCRRSGEFVRVPPSEVDYMDVSPAQLVSIAASLIPFLEHDDANRALMGSNMQRQAVPLVNPEPPVVGTGIESVVARDSRLCIQAKRSGVVESVDANRIVIRPFGEADALMSVVDVYRLEKFRKSNQNTSLSQRPMVRVGMRVQGGEVLADGPSMSRGELSLGKNILVAFMPWGGYNFEDSIVVSERLVREDVFTSVHIEDFECVARETKLGKEEITRDIPNVGDQALKDLDESGVVRIGAYVVPGDILVGKITPKGETQLSPEEKLLRAIFGDKASDVKDTSLRVPPGVEGTVIGARIFTKKGGDKDDYGMLDEREELQRLRSLMQEELRIIEKSFLRHVRSSLEGKVLGQDVQLKLKLKQGTVLDRALLDTLQKEDLRRLILEDQDIRKNLSDSWTSYELQASELIEFYNRKIQKLKKGEELPSGVLKKVRVILAIKRKLHIGDKMAGRHGNKGVVSVILPIEAMPFVADGTPVDMVLNPLGVPSRMNLGQILEAHIGWGCHEYAKKLEEHLKRKREGLRKYVSQVLLEFYDSKEAQDFLEKLDDEEFFEYVQFLTQNGVHITTSVFDGAKEADIKELLAKVGLPTSGQTVLYDGRTGEPFLNQVTVGYMYMLKLIHLAAEKIHSRSIGPYSLVTQQPLGGKAQFGGQRLGEMEVWAMEAYGAAFALQEFLTVKSDDVPGRTAMYESIVKGKFELTSGIPESFNVLMRELRSLALDIELVESNGNGTDLSLKQEGSKEKEGRSK
ncbi:MAG: DNA-directed RNA polymerase subunit beta [Nitrospirota bacterium]|nr:DNA-directed RNA polymerase subunit beta [Nitrospirota bacterium]